MKKEEIRKLQDSKSINYSTRLLGSFSGSNSREAFQQNGKVIKLIRQKIYPLHYSQRSQIMFPKIKEKYSSNYVKPSKMQKQYIQISLDDQNQKKKVSILKTDLQQQLIQRMKLLQNKKSQKIKKGEHKISILKQGLLNKLQPIKCQLQKDGLSHSKMIQTNGHPSILFEQGLQNSNFFEIEANKIVNQSIRHEYILIKIKQQIQQQKDQYFNNINFTQILQDNAQKQNYSLQYLIKSLQKKREKQVHPNSDCSPYETISPNRLSDFMKMLSNSKQRKLNMTEELKLIDLKKQKSSQENQKSVNPHRNDRKRITILQQQNQISQENILSAKFRMKTNHKKLVDLTRIKGKQ